MRSLARIALVAVTAGFAQAAVSETAPGTSAVAVPGSPATAASTPETGAATADTAAQPVSPATTAEPPTDATAASEPAGAEPVAEEADDETGESDTRSDPKYQPPPGYRAEIRVSDGEKVYCRAESVLGTRFSRKVCYSQIQLEQVRDRNASEANDITRRSRVCGSSEACN